MLFWENYYYYNYFIIIINPKNQSLSNLYANMLGPNANFFISDQDQHGLKIILQIDLAKKEIQNY